MNDSQNALTAAERGVGLALYRAGGGTDEAAVNRALDTDPDCQRIARAFTPAVASAVQALSAVIAQFPPHLNDYTGGDPR